MKGKRLSQSRHALSEPAASGHHACATKVARRTAAVSRQQAQAPSCIATRHCTHIPVYGIGFVSQTRNIAASDEQLDGRAVMSDNGTHLAGERVSA
jgi:hypothetical protein